MPSNSTMPTGAVPAGPCTAAIAMGVPVVLAGLKEYWYPVGSVEVVKS